MIRFIDEQIELESLKVLDSLFDNYVDKRKKENVDEIEDKMMKVFNSICSNDFEDLKILIKKKNNNINYLLKMFNKNIIDYLNFEEDKNESLDLYHKNEMIKETKDLKEVLENALYSEDLKKLKIYNLINDNLNDNEHESNLIKLHKEIKNNYGLVMTYN